MVRAGGVSYTRSTSASRWACRISDLTLLKTGKPARSRQGLHGHRLGERQRRHRRSGDLGRGDQPHSEEESCGRGRNRPVSACWGRNFFAQTHANFCILESAGKAMADENNMQSSRRNFLRASLAAGGTALGSAALGAPQGASDPKNLPPNVPGLDPDTRRRRRHPPLRPPVEARGARHPPRRRMAHSIPRKLRLLHPAARSRRHHHAERRLLRAPSRRHRGGESRRLSANHSRPRRQTADLHTRRHQAHAARQPRLFLRMRGELRHGVAWRTAQRLPVHARHGPLRDVHRRAAQDAAARGRHQAHSQVAPHGRWRRRRDDALASDSKGARRRARRLPHERRDAAAGERLSGPHGAPRLGGQHVDQMDSPHRSRRSALAPPRGNLEVHGPARKRQGAALHLHHGREVHHHQSEPAGADQSQVRFHRAVRPRVVRARARSRAWTFRSTAAATGARRRSTGPCGTRR